MFKRVRPQERRRPVPHVTEKPPVMQYYRGSTTATRDQPPARRAEPRRAGRVTSQLHRLPAYISMVAIVISLLYCSILGNSASVVLSATPLHPDSFYSKRVGDALNKSVLNHSKLTLDVTGFKKDIQAAIPEAAAVTVSIPLVGRKPVVGLSLVAPKYVLTLPGNKAFILGSNGVALAEAKDAAEAIRQKLPVLQEDVPLAVEVGKTVMSASDLAFIDVVTSELTKAHIGTSLLQLPVGAGELHVHLAGEGYIVKFALMGDARQQVGAFLAVRSQASIEKPSSYIDVRIGERAYVK